MEGKVKKNLKEIPTEIGNFIKQEGCHHFTVDQGLVQCVCVHEYLPERERENPHTHKVKKEY